MASYKNYAGASAECESMGGHLAAVSTQQELMLLSQYITEYTLGRAVFLGGELDINTGLVVWADGTDLCVG